MKRSVVNPSSFGVLYANVSDPVLGPMTAVRGAIAEPGNRGTYVALRERGFEYGVLRRSQPAGDMSGVERVSPAAHLDEIHTTLRRRDWFQGYLVAATIGALGVLANAPSLLAVYAVAVLVPGYFVRRWSADRRTVRLFYDVSDPRLLHRAALSNTAGEALAQSVALWHIYSSQATFDRKRNAGAGTLVKRTNVLCRRGALPRFEMNVEPWSIALGPQQLLFLPDCLLVHEYGRFMAYPYEFLEANVRESSFIEEGLVPSDARQVSTTWKYVNKSGGPDRRFNDNRQLPVMQYGNITLTCENAPSVTLEASNVRMATRAQQAFERLHNEARPRPTLTEAPQRISLDVPSLQPVYPPSVPAAHEARSSVESVPSSAPRQRKVDELALLTNVLVLLRYVAVADRKISPEEIEAIEAAMRDFAVEAEHATVVMHGFKTMKSDDADALVASRSVLKIRPEHAERLLATAKRIATSEGRVTPKERERLDLLATWLKRS